MVIDEAFRKALRRLDSESISTTADVVFIIDRQLKLRGFNAAWEAFARANGGEQVLSRYAVGRSILEAMCPAARTYYQRRYQRAIARHSGFELDYECSSARLFRRFRLYAEPLLDHHGLVVRNRLLQERPHHRVPHHLDARYFDQHDITVQCCHCRRAQHQRHELRWDWVPELVDAPYPHTFFVLCPRCYERFYPAGNASR